MNVNKLSLNISKTNLLLFNIINKNRNINLDLNINNIKVKQVSKIKLLGIIIDFKLNWKLQLNYVSSKLSRTIAILQFLIIIICIQISILFLILLHLTIL